MGGIIFSWPGHPHKQSTVNEDYNCAFDIILRILVLLRGWKIKNLGEGKMGSIFCIDEKMTRRRILLQRSGIKRFTMNRQYCHCSFLPPFVCCMADPKEV